MSRKLLQSTLLFAINTLVSRLLGFARDMVLAQLFGAQGEFDAFIVAFRIPNFMRRLFAEGAFSQAFVPVLSQYRKQHHHDEVRTFIAHMLGCWISVVVLFVILGMILSPLLIIIFTPGFLHHGARYILAYQMLRITFPYLGFITVVAFFAALLNSDDVFGPPSFAPVLLNISLIACAVWLTPHLAVAITSLAWGVFIAGIMQVVFLLPFVRIRKLLPKPSVNFANAQVKKVLRLMVPALLGSSAAQINLLLDTLFASFLAVGSISWLYYSERLMMLPLGIFGVAISTVILPTLSRCNNDNRRYSDTLSWALRLLFLLGVPSAVGLFILATPIISTLFQSHVFVSNDIMMTQQSLEAFSLGLLAFMVTKVLTSAFYARGDTKTPATITMIAIISNVIFNAIFFVPLKHAGIALATSLSGMLNSLLLWYQLRRATFYQSSCGWRAYFRRLIVANVVMAGFLLFARGSSVVWCCHPRLWRVWHLAWLMIIAVLIYVVMLWLLGMRFRHLTMFTTKLNAR